MVCSISGSFIRAPYLKVHEIIKKQAVVKELNKMFNRKLIYIGTCGILDLKFDWYIEYNVRKRS